MISEVYDIETLYNVFTYTGYDRATKQYHQFIIWRHQNDYEALIKHLKRNGLIMIGFNNENFDYPVLHHMINHYNDYKYLDGHNLAMKIYEKAQAVINNDWNMVGDWNKHMIQIDLFRIHHYHNAARSTSLKSLQIAMQLENVEDMPIPHDVFISKQEHVDEILHYNKNDVYATNAFFDLTLGRTDHEVYKGRNLIELRQKIALSYGLPCLNWDDVKIGTELILELYSRKTNINKNLIKRASTPRHHISIEDCIPTWCNFKSKPFLDLVDRLKTYHVYDGVLKGVLTDSAVFHGIKIDYGTGGAHACIKPGVYKSGNGKVILDLDITSMYPFLAITQGLYPEHLGQDFIDIYDKDIVSVRVNEKNKPKKDQDFVIIEGFKLAANGALNIHNTYLFNYLIN